MSPADFRKWIAIGTGAGIEIGSDDLNITVARVRPGGVQILGSLNILKYREQPAASWGATYADFLRKLGGSYLTATVMLPRHDVIVRQISLPGVLNRDVPAALNFQIDAAKDIHAVGGGGNAFGESGDLNGGGLNRGANGIGLQFFIMALGDVHLVPAVSMYRMLGGGVWFTFTCCPSFCGYASGDRCVRR